MRFLIFILLFSLTINKSIACLSADQNRMFPIGISPKGIVVVEIHMIRSDSTDGKTERLHPLWHGISYLNTYNKNYKLIESRLLDTLKSFPESTYLNVVKAAFIKGIKQAGTIPNIIYAEPQDISFCNYQTNCKSASLQTDTINNKAYVILKSKKKQEVTVLYNPKSFASNYINYYSGFDYEPSESRIKDLIEGLLINSVREYKIGEYYLTIIHLGKGQDFRQAGEAPKEYKPDIQINTLENSIFKEPVLHHGHGFDFFILDIIKSH
ncbi:MAG: hypothetical protein J7604_23135 [Sporocytophaga sp.]|uniref:hypothetical protein n=1 Tax=Sporocytophaga sp. TaxID=2231183 RepID=UPI001B15E16F|nr:hypothetical protein [Sporocytophaga sp.]MBO9703127.1 hypothetical protein [Sporocytophaga sp.]